MSDITLSIEHKAFAPDPAPVLSDLQLRARSGEFVAILGPSGCGKSTLLNIVADLDSDYRGSVSCGGRGIAEVRLGYVFQEARLMPWLSVRENVELVLDSEDARDRAERALRLAGLADVLDQYPAQLSGGMRRRVALARACAVEPELLLLDEPFVSLDAPAADRLRAELLELWRRVRATVLFVTHDLREALFLADRVVFVSARPARVIQELRVPLARPRDVDAPELTRLRAELLAQHPELLAGVLGGAREQCA